MHSVRRQLARVRTAVLRMTTTGAFACLAAVPATAGGNVASGEGLARKLCVSCHIVGGEAASGTVSADVPSFAAIAAKPGQTAETIAGRIVVPHPPMPQIQLTREEIADLAAYILSLKKE